MSVAYVLVGERPSKEGPRPHHRLNPEWPIAKMLVQWLGPETLDAPFINVYPIFRSVYPRVDLVTDLIDQEAPRAIITLGMVATVPFAPRHNTARDAGTIYRYEGSWVVPFPHPSGRNRLLNGVEGRRLVDQCLEGLRVALSTKVPG